MDELSDRRRDLCLTRQHSQETDVHVHGEIRTHNPSGHRDPPKRSTRRKYYLSHNFSIKSNVNEQRTYPGLPVNDNGLWRTIYNNELYKLSDELEIVKVVKTRILRWLGHVFSMQELDPCRTRTVLKPEGTLRWLESAEEDQKEMDVRNRRRK
jgi:hypothetical protein